MKKEKKINLHMPRTYISAVVAVFDSNGVMYLKKKFFMCMEAVFFEVT